MKVRKWLGPVVALGLILVGCDVDDDGGDDAASGEGGGGGGSQGEITIAYVTHGDGGDFWSVVKAGADAAAEELDVTLNYQESNNDPEAQVQLIETALAGDIDGLVVSLPNPDAVEDPVRQAVDQGVPVITINSGVDVFEDFGAITHVGQTERIAGEGAGERLAEEGGTKLLCVVHEQGNIGLQERCNGAAETFGGQFEELNVAGTGDVATTTNEIAAKLGADPAVDAVLTLNPTIAVAARDAIGDVGSSAMLATFDLSGDVIDAIEGGEIVFAVDQQQYLQGYLPIVFLKLFVENKNTVGGGQPVLTGPGFVDRSNAADVAELAAAGTR
ncbi:MAG: sugar ABC transporter substrate-binding protein [Acidimicrobiales bacterium]